MTKLIVTFATCIFCSFVVSNAGEIASKEVAHSEFPFEKGDWELQKLVGAFFGIEKTSEKRPDINTGDFNLRLGLMLTNVERDGWFRGNFEGMIDLFGSRAFAGPTGWLTGANLLLRYNFVQSDSRWIPYLQIGAGGLYNDVYRHQRQRLIGEAFEFNLQASVGVRYMLNQNWAIALEGGYRHISNANLASRNLGLNSLGGLLGLSCFY